MFEIIIKQADGSVYWTEHFGSLAKAEEWIAEEQTRKYWNKTYTYEILDRTPPPHVDSPEEVEKKSQMATFKNRIKTLAQQEDLTASEVKEAILKFIKFMALRGDVG